MKVKKIPLRTCVVTREKLPKKELLRIVRTPEGKVIVDESGKMNGRGAQIKKDVTALEQAKKKKILERHLECIIEESVYEDIEEKLKK